MTQEEKQLLLADLCTRLPYGVKGKLYDSNYTAILKDVRYSCFCPLLVRPLECPLTNDECSMDVDEFKPYLRPMSSMTEEELSEFSKLFNEWHDKELFDYIEEEIEFSIWKHKGISPVVFDWLIKHHFDYRGLIEKGLALEAKEGMYNV